jgi:hypothetical protein
MERLPAGRQVSEHKLFGRIYPPPLFVDGVDFKILA